MMASGAAPRSLSRLLYLTLNLLALAAAGFQLFIDATATNAISVAIVVASTLATLQYLERTDAFDTTPLSSLALLGLCVTTQWTSLVAQSFAGKALVDELQVPTRTFLMLGGVQVLAVLLHAVYRFFQPFSVVSTALAERVFKPMGAFEPPSVAAVWTMAVIGVASLAMGSAETGDGGGKALQALGFLAWMPVMVPIFHAAYGERYCSLRVHVPFLIGYAVLLVGIGMARNARVLMLVGPIQLLLVLLIYGLRDRRLPSRRLLGLLVAGCVAAGFATFLAADLATAMVVVREQRDSLHPLQMIGETFAALADRSKLEIYRYSERIGAGFQVYEEVYLDNPLLARFSETKFHDNMLAILLRLNDAERASIGEITWIKILTILPQPVLDLLGLGIDKDFYFFSVGDYYRMLTENAEFLGGFATGSIWVDVLAIFGWGSPFAVGLILLIFFIVLDAHARATPNRLDLSPLAVCTLWSIFLYGLGGESLAAKVGMLVRNFPEKLILYCVLAGVLRMLLPWQPNPKSRH